MVTTTVERSAIDRDAAGGHSRISWGAIFAATAVSLAVWLLLYAIGLAVGFTAVEPTEASSLRAVGIGTGIWSVLSPLIALFIGGWFASRESSVHNRLDGAMHGVVVWALSALLGIVLLGSLLTNIVGGAASFVGGTASMASQVAGAPSADEGQGPGMLNALGLSANDLVAPINERLQAEGHPPVSVAGLQAALQDVVNQAVRTGELNRQDIVAALSANTSLSQQDAQAVAAQIESQWQAQSQQLQQQAQGAAAQAADVTAGTLWALAAALLLSLLAAVLGAALGMRRRHGERVETTRHTHGEFAPAH